MGFASGLVVYVIVWWLVLFVTLPFGVRRDENPEDGHEPGAPVNPRIWTKVGVTTIIAALIWGAIYWAVDAELISFQGP